MTAAVMTAHHRHYRGRGIERGMRNGFLYAGILWLIVGVVAWAIFG